MKKILAASINYPDTYNLWGKWNKEANLAISKIDDISMEILAPRPYTLPFKWFKYHYFSKIPLCEQGIEGKIHHPRFPFLLPKKIFYPLAGNFYSFFIGNYVKKNISDIDIVHSHHAYPDGYGLTKICQDLHTPLVIDIVGAAFFSDWLKQPVLRKKIFHTLKISSKIICVSNNLFTTAIQHGIPEEKLAYIPMGVDIERFDRITKSDSCIKNKNQKSDKVIFLFVGHLNKKKGVAYLLQAISKLENEIKKKCHFIIVGEGPEKNHLLSDADSFGLNAYITFAGRVEEDELIRLYASADVFVLPSLLEGRPTVINEAMVSECAIIASNIYGIPEQVTDGYNGYLVEPCNPVQLSQKISELANDEQLMHTMGKNSKQKILDEGVTWEKYAEKVNNVYNEVLRD